MWSAVLPSTEILYTESINIQGNGMSGVLNILSCIQPIGLIFSLARQLHLNDEFFITMQVNEVKRDRSGFTPKGPSASAVTVPVSQTGLTRLQASSDADQNQDLAARAHDTGSAGARQPSFPTTPRTDNAGSLPQAQSTPPKLHHGCSVSSWAAHSQHRQPCGAQQPYRRHWPPPQLGGCTCVYPEEGWEWPPTAPAGRLTAGGPTLLPRNGPTTPSGRGFGARREKERSQGGWRPQKRGRLGREGGRRLLGVSLGAAPGGSAARPPIARHGHRKAPGQLLCSYPVSPAHPFPHSPTVARVSRSSRL